LHKALVSVPSITKNNQKIKINNSIESIINRLDQAEEGISETENKVEGLLYS
jgi:hypothetical protein